MKLWIDDIRDPDGRRWQERYEIPMDVVWVKTYDEAYELIVNNEITWVAFDNDLGDSYNRQGKHLFNLLEERVVMGLNPMFQAIFQTANAVARRQMYQGYMALIDRCGEPEE